MNSWLNQLHSERSRILAKAGKGEVTGCLGRRPLAAQCDAQSAFHLRFCMDDYRSDR